MREPELGNFLVKEVKKIFFRTVNQRHGKEIPGEKEGMR
jgi:hypothetical protein